MILLFIDLDISNGVLEEVRIENLPSLKNLRLKSGSVKRIIKWLEIFIFRYKLSRNKVTKRFLRSNSKYRTSS